MIAPPVVRVDKVCINPWVPGVGGGAHCEQVGEGGGGGGVAQPGYLGWRWQREMEEEKGSDLTVFSCLRNTVQSREMLEPSSTSNTVLFFPSKAAEKTPCLQQKQNQEKY